LGRTRVTGDPGIAAPSTASKAYVDYFWDNVARLIRNADKGEEITVDAAHRVIMPAFVMDAIRECEVKLIIQWNGGEDIVIEKAYDGEVKHAYFNLSELKDLLK